jgi:ectoine hydroxylase-related dioxygenase (phytanoyl-CoA dioxygenase family)
VLQYFYLRAAGGAPPPRRRMGGSTLSDTAPLSDAEVAAAIEQLDSEGYCLLKNRIPRDVALSIADELLDQHEAAHSAAENAATFQLIFGLFNTDERTWQYMPAHPDVVKVAGNFLGNGQVRAIEGISGRTLPGAKVGALHKDCAQDFDQLPDCCWGINGIWMLSDFTETNGATKIVRRSHVEQRENPPAGVAWEDVIEADAVPVIGEAGDVFLWDMGTLHQSGANDSDEVRVSFNCGYLPAWFNHRIMGGHQPTQPSELAKMPTAVRQYLPRVTGYDRHDAYEYSAWPRPPTEPESAHDWRQRAAELLDLSLPPPPPPTEELATDAAISAATTQMERDGYCLLEAQLAPAVVTALSGRLSACCARHKPTAAGGAVFGVMNHEPAAWAVGASHPSAVQIARHLIGHRARVVDVAVASPAKPEAAAAATGSPAVAISAHRSASQFETGMPQPECPWLIEATWSLPGRPNADTSVEVTLVPGSHRSRRFAPDVEGATTVVRLKRGDVLLSHGALWMERHVDTSLPACARTGDGRTTMMHVLYGATWWNHWLEHDLEPLWPETYASMPTAVQALMPGLLAAERSEVFESAFDEDGELNRARFERRRSAAMAEMEAARQAESKL